MLFHFQKKCVGVIFWDFTVNNGSTEPDFEISRITWAEAKNSLPIDEHMLDFITPHLLFKGTSSFERQELLKNENEKKRYYYSAGHNPKSDK